MTIAERPNREGLRSALVRELRESCDYLQDEGWERTATIMRMAADEIEYLSKREQELQNLLDEAQQPPQRKVAGKG